MTAKLDPPFCFCQKVAVIQFNKGRIIYECHHAPITGLSVPCRREFTPTHEYFASSEQEHEQGKEQGKEQYNGPSTWTHDETLADAHPHSLTRITREKGTHPRAAVDNQGVDNTTGCEGLPAVWDPHQKRKVAVYQLFHPESSQTIEQRQQSNANTISDISYIGKLRTNASGVKVCGFHMHFNEWIVCLRLLWRSEYFRMDSLLRPKDMKGETKDKEEEESDEMDEALAMFSQHHHEIVRKHPTLHSMLIALSTGSRCISHMITVGRWLNQSQSIGSPGHLASVLPRCFCRQPMLATTLRVGFEPEELYVCRVRRNGEGGCARVIRVQDTMLNTYTNISKTPTWPTSATTTLTPTPAHGRKVRPTPKPREQDLLEAMSLSAPDVWESIESKCKSEWKPLPNTFADTVSSWAGNDLLGDDNWAGPIARVVPREALTCKFRPASRPVWIVSDAFGQLRSQDKNSSLKVVKGGSGSNKGKGSDALSLEEYIDQHEWVLKPRTVEMDRKVHTIRTASEVFEDSITRLDQRIKVMQLEGLDNPRFECRQCQDGALDHAIVPCYHLVMCDKCIALSKECVKCHEPIDGVRRVYWG